MFGTTCAFVLCNMDKVNISVAIIPMAKDMGWSVGQAGVLQSAFFYGFALSQLPLGIVMRSPLVKGKRLGNMIFW